MKKLLLIGFLMLFITALMPVSASLQPADNDIGIELTQLDNDITIQNFDFSVNPDYASSVEGIVLKYPVVEQAVNIDKSDYMLDYKPIKEVKKLVYK